MAGTSECNYCAVNYIYYIFTFLKYNNLSVIKRNLICYIIIFILYPVIAQNVTLGHRKILANMQYSTL